MFEYRIVTAEYFLDRMEEYEVVTMIENLKFLDRNKREVDGFSSYITVQMNSKKKLQPKDIYSLPWDEEEQNEVAEMTKEDKEKMADGVVKKKGESFSFDVSV